MTHHHVISLGSCTTHTTTHRKRYRTFVTTAAATPSTSTRLLDCSDFVRHCPGNPLTDRIHRTSTALAAAVSATGLTAVTIYSHLRSLQSFELVTSRATPKLVLTYNRACARTGHFRLTVPLFRQIVRSCGSPGLLSRTRATLTRTLASRTRRSKTNTLPRPNFDNCADSKAAMMRVHGSSPRTVQVIFDKPRPQFRRLPPYARYRAFVNRTPRAYPGVNPITRVALPPNSCNILIHSADSPHIAPFAKR